MLNGIWSSSRWILAPRLSGLVLHYWVFPFEIHTHPVQFEKKKKKKKSFHRCVNISMNVVNHPGTSNNKFMI